MPRTLYMAPDRVRRTIVRLAYEIVERNRGADNLVILGMKKRGVALAGELAAEISRNESVSLPVGRLDVRPYRDDLKPGEAHEDQSSVEVDVTDRDVILVDDVLFTGRTARAALDAVLRFGRPRTIQLAVLVDRGHREYPIQPDYVGRLIQTKYKERVVVTVEEGFAIHVEE